MESTSLIVKGTQLIISKLNLWKKASNWILRKTLPLKENQFLGTFEFVPFISLNYPQHIFTLYLSMKVHNCSAYTIDVYGYKCEISLSSNPFMSIEKSEIFTLKPGDQYKIYLEHNLFPGEIELAREKATEGKIHLAGYRFYLTTRNRFDDRKIHPIGIASALSISKSGHVISN
jgi:hypothetical protein